MKLHLIILFLIYFWGSGHFKKNLIYCKLFSSLFGGLTIFHVKIQKIIKIPQRMKNKSPKIIKNFDNIECLAILAHSYQNKQGVTKIINNFVPFQGYKVLIKNQQEPFKEYLSLCVGTGSSALIFKQHYLVCFIVFTHFQTKRSINFFNKYSSTYIHIYQTSFTDIFVLKH